MDPTNDLMLAPNEADPQQLLQDLLAISSAPAAARTGATASTFPSRRMPAPASLPMPSGPVSPPMPPSDPSTGGGTDWRAILRLVAPAVGSLVAGGGHQMPAFWSGYQGRLAELDAQRQQQQQQADNKRKAAGDFLMQIEHGAEGYDDPTQLAQYLDAADQAGAMAGLFKPGEIKAKGYRVPDSKVAEKSLKELTDLVDGALKAGYDPDQLTEAGAVLTRKDGSTVPFETAYELTHRPPMNAQGKPIARPAKAASTEEERFLQQRAKDYGYKSLDAVDADTQLSWRTDFRDAGRPSEKLVAPGGVDAQYGDLVELWKTAHKGQEPPASVRTQLRKQANQVNDKPATLGGMNSLYGQIDPKSLADAIERGDQSPIITEFGRPASAAVASELSKRGVKLTQLQNDWKATQRYYQTLNSGQQVRIRQNIDNVAHSLDTISDLADRWNGGGLPLLNRANLALAKSGAYGKDWASVANQLEAQIADVTSEMAGVYMGGNSPTDHALALASKNLSGDWDKKVLQDMIRLARTNLKNRQNAIESTGPVTPSGDDNKYYTPKPVPSHDSGTGVESWVRDPATGALVRKVSK
jgi:hypothetical protein